MNGLIVSMIERHLCGDDLPDQETDLPNQIDRLLEDIHRLMVRRSRLVGNQLLLLASFASKVAVNEIRVCK